jgi:hypothetical protein
VRRLHKAFLRYHDPNNWPLLREALRRMGRAELIGSSRLQLIPAYQPAGSTRLPAGKPPGGKPLRTQHTGLPVVPARVPVRSRAQSPAGLPAGTPTRVPVPSRARPPARKTARDRH